MNINDDRSACSDSWMMSFVTDVSEYGYGHELGGDENGANTHIPAKGELINQGVEANTLYAVYVQTKLVNHRGELAFMHSYLKNYFLGARNAISKILFVKTLFTSPVLPF